MRVLSLGFPLPGASIDNFSFFSAPSFFDYDALIIDPRALSQLIEDVVERNLEHATFTGECVINGFSGQAGVGLGELLHTRADETMRFLARGGLIVCLAVPDVVHRGIEGLSDLTRYYWLPDDTASYLASVVKRGSGTEFAPMDLDQPFAAMLASTRAKLTYQVHFELADAETVIGQSIGGAAVAIALPASGGQLVLIPPPTRPLDSHGRYQMSEALQNAIRQTLRGSSGSSAPAWLSDYPLPRLSDQHRSLETARERLTAAKDEVSVAYDEVATLEGLRRILWEEGRGLEGAVRDALAHLGFRSRSSESGSDSILEKGMDGATDQTFLLEAVGSEEAIGMDAHYRMRRRLENAIAARLRAQGLLVVNGYRRRAPAERPEQCTEELRAAARQLGYGVTTTTQLYSALHAALEGNDATVQAYCQRLLATTGPLSDD